MVVWRFVLVLIFPYFFIIRIIRFVGMSTSEIAAIVGSARTLTANKAEGCYFVEKANSSRY